MALAIKDKLRFLEEALDIDPGHYDSLKLRALIYYASRKYESMKDEARTMIAVEQQDPLGYSLRATALLQLGDHDGAIKDYDRALERTPEGDPRRTKLYDQRCRVCLRMGDYERVIADAQECLKLSSDPTIFQLHIFCALTALGKYEPASALFQQIADAGPEYRRRFKDWSMKHVFGSIEAGQPWHPPESRPDGLAFLAMLEAEEIYRSLEAKGGPLIPDGFAADWSADGNKLVFCSGVPGNSGIAVLDLITRRTELLIAPGKNPKWSPDGQHIAFIRDRRLLPLSRLVANEPLSRSPSWKSELWIMKTDGTEPRRVTHGLWPSWSQDSGRIYNQSWTDRMLYSISIERGDADQKPILPFPHHYCSVSPDEQYAACAQYGSLKIVDLASRSIVAQWTAPVKLWGGNWNPGSHEFSMGGYSRPEDRTGLWIYDLNRREATQVLCGQITNAAWAPDGAKLAFSLGAPFYEIWEADLDPSVSTIESIGPGRTPEEYCRQMVEKYSETIATDSADANDHLRRAGYYHYMQDEDGANADMKKYRAILNPQMDTGGHGGRPETADSQVIHTSLVFGTPTALGPIVNSTACDWGPSISASGLELYFDSRRTGDWDIWVTTRATAAHDWEPPVNLGAPVNGPHWDQRPCISADGLTLFFGSLRSGSWELWMTTRQTIDGSWREPVNMGSPVNSSALDIAPSISSDGLSLFFGSERSGSYGSADIWMTTRETTHDDWGTPMNLGPAINSVANEAVPSISHDGLLFFFSGAAYGPFRAAGCGEADLWVSTRASTSDPWSTRINLGQNVNSSDQDLTPNISADGS
ncbi:MAG: hypothetical protein AMJ65_19145, partial [Phycisphaerae bacterium SG8_4]